MRIYYQAQADLYTEHVVPVFNAQQGDTGRGVDITLTDCGAVVVPDASESLRLYCKRPDDHVSYLPATLSGSAVRVELTNQLLSVPGLVECELQVGAGADMVTTPVFKVLVLPSNYDAQAAESTDEYTALDAALATVQSYDGRIAENAADITALDGDITALDGRVTAVEGGLDALDGRVDDIGTVTEDIVTEAVTTTTATYKSVASVAHGVGTYLVTTSAAFSQNTSGIRIAIVTASASSNTVVSQLATDTAVPLNGYWTRLSHAFVIRASSAGSWHLKVYQNSGGDLNVSTACIQATKLSD